MVLQLLVILLLLFCITSLLVCSLRKKSMDCFCFCVFKYSFYAGDSSILIKILSLNHAYLNIEWTHLCLLDLRHASHLLLCLITAYFITNKVGHARTSIMFLFPLQRNWVEECLYYCLWEYYSTANLQTHAIDWLKNWLILIVCY